MALAIAGALPHARAVDDVVDLGFYNDPNIPSATVVKVFPERLTSLWLQALARPENDMKSQAAATIALAHRRGMAGLEKTIEPLVQTLDQTGQHSTVRLAAAQALITLGARQAADSLFKHAQSDGIEMRNLVEPALARWDYGPARAVWLERLNQSGLPGRGWVIALQALAAVGETKATPRLRELTLERFTDPIIRLEAARALGAIRTTGLEKDAERLASDKPGSIAQLAAASLLRKHRSAEAVKLLQRLAVEAEPAAAAVALETLLDHDPKLVMPLLERVIASPDAKVRMHGVEAHRRNPLPEHMRPVANLLDDPHPQVRIRARKALFDVAAKHRELVLREATRLLATDEWRALEQATLLLALMDHKPAAPRLVELLQFERPEVYVSAAWGLRKLAVADTLPAQQKEIERRWERSFKLEASESRDMIDLQVAQLAQSLGRAKYSPAATVLAQFIPKQFNIGAESRAAAIWALGLIHQDAPPDKIVQALIGRAGDESVTFPEDMRVRRMAVVALGRMKAKDAEETVRKYYYGKLTVEPFPNACGWAVEQITGEKLPASGVANVVQTGWFLEPND